MDVVFAPDSELILPGRGGAADPLGEVRAAALSELTHVLQGVDVRSVLVCYCASSPFGTPLPGAEIGTELLAGAGFTGDVVFHACQWASEVKVSPPCPEILDAVSNGGQEHSVVLLLGTGSAAREEDSPIPYRPESHVLDDQIQRALEQGNPGKFKEMVTDLPREVGATLIPTMIEIVSLNVSKVQARNILSFDDLGVRYFVGSWRCDVGMR